MDWEDVKTVKDCIEEATMDCYDEWEQISGWCCCLEEILATTEGVKVFGEEVELARIEQDGLSLVAICFKGKKKAKVSLESIELIKPTKAQKLWLKAWIEWIIP